MTRPLPESLGEIVSRARSAGAAWVGLDFDGTLAHHHNDPFAVELSPGTRAALDALARVCAVAVISGRALADVRARVGVSGIAYAGNHGLEIEAPGLVARDAAALAARPFLATAADLLRPVAEVHDLPLQDKGLTLAIDYRGRPATARAEVARAIDDAVRATGGLYAHHSLIGSEVRPLGAGHKGTDALRLWDHQLAGKGVAVFAGDDRTDEDAFAALAERAGAITVKVGDGETRAAYRAAGPDAVRELLERLTAALRPSA